VEVERGLYDLANDEGGDVLAESLAFGDEGEEILAGDVLLNDVDVGLAADGLLVLDYLGVGDDLHDFALVVEHGDGLLRQLLSAHVLERVGTPRFLVGAAVDDGEGAGAYDFVGVVEVVQRLSGVHAEQLQVVEHLLLQLEVDHELLVVLVPVRDLYSVPVLVLHLVHRQTLQEHHLEGKGAFLSRLGQDQHILHQHPVNRRHPPPYPDGALEGLLHLGEEVGLFSGGCPYICVEAGVVALEELAVALDPLCELGEGEAA
jgi:hypothetical protein